MNEYPIKIYRSPIPMEYLDVDGTLTANSDTKVPSQKAVKTYIGTAAPASSAKILTAQAEASLSAEVNLGALTTGLLKHTVAAGVSTPATATADTDYVTPTGTCTLTNKRITPRVVTLPSNDATITVGETATYTTDSADVFKCLALAQGTDFGAPGGTPTDGQRLMFRIKDDGTARALTWNAVFDEGDELALPTTTVLGKTMYVNFIYDSVATVWHFVGQIGGF